MSDAACPLLWWIALSEGAERSSATTDTNWLSHASSSRLLLNSERMLTEQSRQRWLSERKQFYWLYAQHYSKEIIAFEAKTRATATATSTGNTSNAMSVSKSSALSMFQEGHKADQGECKSFDIIGSVANAERAAIRIARKSTERISNSLWTVHDTYKSS